jgi:hypothetical protein
MPKKIYQNHKFLAQKEILTFEEITRLMKLFTSVGVRKARFSDDDEWLFSNRANSILAQGGFKTDDRQSRFVG